MSMSLASELESSLTNFAGSNSTLASSSKFTAIGIPSGQPIVVGGDYWREVIILNICVKRGGGVIIQGKQLTEGWPLFEEIPYLPFWSVHVVQCLTSWFDLVFDA